jgi:hypothetical protein
MTPMTPAQRRELDTLLQVITKIGDKLAVALSTDTEQSYIETFAAFRQWGRRPRRH